MNSNDESSSEYDSDLQLLCDEKGIFNIDDDFTAP